MSSKARVAPVIGISAYEEEAAWGLWDQLAVVLPATYVEAVVRAGGVPVVLPVVPEGVDVGRLVSGLDGLILVGGPDVAPERYGAEREPATQEPRATRDSFELSLLAAATSRDLPVLAICRGMQLLNVARGGTLHQHLPDVVGHDAHSPTPGTFGAHRVELDPKSRLAEVISWTEADVPTHHHQGVDRLAPGLEAAAWAEDRTVEAIEDPSARFLLGVQWHPEVGEDPSLFDALVRVASDHLGSPG